MKSQHSIHMYTTLIRNLSWDETRERKVSVVLAGGPVEQCELVRVTVKIKIGLPLFYTSVRELIPWYSLFM